MARGQHVGRIDEDLIARVDVEAHRLGQTRRVFTERALEAALSEANGATKREQAGPAPVPSSEGVRPAASPRASDRASRTVPSRSDAFRQAEAARKAKR